jgi:hypothetical protein
LIGSGAADRREQPADQLGSLPEPLILGWFYRGEKFGFDLREHLRRHRQLVRSA